MKQKHILTMLFLGYTIITLNAMDEITFTQVEPKELGHLESLACEVYAQLTSQEAKNAFRTSIEEKIFPYIVSQKSEKLCALVASLGGKEIGFITYEPINENAITFHLSPIQEPYTFDAYKQVLEIIREKYAKECDIDVYAGCPDCLPGLAKLLHDLGYVRVETYPCAEDVPKPAEAVPAYKLRISDKKP